MNHPLRFDLSRFSSSGFDRGGSRLKEALWLAVKCLFFQTSLPWPYGLRRSLLRCFGAKVGRNVVIKANVNVSFPWRLSVGDHVWLGEEVMILSLAQVTIESNVCVSQRAFLCTGSHNHRREDFVLMTKPIILRAGSWVAAQAFVAPGVEVGSGAVVSAGSIVLDDVPTNAVVRGNPAQIVESIRCG